MEQIEESFAVNLSDLERKIRIQENKISFNNRYISKNNETNETIYN